MIVKVYLDGSVTCQGKQKKDPEILEKTMVD
jgi:hypothetical protein